MDPRGQQARAVAIAIAEAAHRDRDPAVGGAGGCWQLRRSTNYGAANDAIEAGETGRVFAEPAPREVQYLLMDWHASAFEDGGYDRSSIDAEGAATTALASRFFPHSGQWGGNLANFSANWNPQSPV